MTSRIATTKRQKYNCGAGPGQLEAIHYSRRYNVLQMSLSLMSVTHTPRGYSILDLTDLASSHGSWARLDPGEKVDWPSTGSQRYPSDELEPAATKFDRRIGSLG